jgi:hypothetical protein
MCLAEGSSFSSTPRQAGALSVVSSTGRSTCRSARVKNRRAAAASRFGDNSTSMTCPNWSTARYR